MQVTSINVGAKRELSGRSYSGTTGIFKEPVQEAEIRRTGVTGDAVCDRRHHGGPDQAVYLYRAEDHDWWSAELGRPIPPGTFGDNLTVAGLPDAALAIGTRLVLPRVVLEVTAPRIPCNTLAQRMDDPQFVKAFVKAERPGAYLRVIEPGVVRTGDAVTLEAADALTTVDLFRDSYRTLDAERIEQWLALPIDARTRAKLEAKRA